MEKNNKLNLVYSTRNTVYKGRMSDYQLEGNKLNNRKFTTPESPYNIYQNFLYNRALYGLTVFSKEELAVMHWGKKKRITKVHLRTKKVLNIWKQEIVNGIFERFFKPKFTDSKTECGREFIELYSNETDPELENRISFSILGLGKKDIISKLIQQDILPKNFYELKPVHFGLPRLLISENYGMEQTKQCKHNILISGESGYIRTI